MGIDHSNPYIHSTTVLCDKRTKAIFKPEITNIYYVLMYNIVYHKGRSVSTLQLQVPYKY